MLTDYLSKQEIDLLNSIADSTGFTDLMKISLKYAIMKDTTDIIMWIIDLYLSTKLLNDIEIAEIILLKNKINFIYHKDLLLKYLNKLEEGE